MKMEERGKIIEREKKRKERKEGKKDKQERQKTGLNIQSVVPAGMQFSCRFNSILLVFIDS